MNPSNSMTLEAVDLVGSYVFALSGGTLAGHKQFDLFGVLLLSFVAAVAGGITRDVLIGAIPPAAVASWHILAVALLGGWVTYFASSTLLRHQRTILLFDAIGLALFAVTGAQKALRYQIDPVMAVVLGMVSGVGGGVLRDVLAGEVATILRADLYATAALAGAGIVVFGQMLDKPAPYPVLLGAATCVFLRLMAIYRGWHLPLPKQGAGGAE